MGGSAWDGKRMEEGWTGHVNPVSIQVIDTTPFVHRRGHLFILKGSRVVYPPRLDKYYSVYPFERASSQYYFRHVTSLSAVPRLILVITLPKTFHRFFRLIAFVNIDRSNVYILRDTVNVYSLTENIWKILIEFYLDISFFISSSTSIRIFHFTKILQFDYCVNCVRAEIKRTDLRKIERKSWPNRGCRSPSQIRRHFYPLTTSVHSISIAARKTENVSNNHSPRQSPYKNTVAEFNHHDG